MDEPSKTYGRRRGCLYVLLTCRRLILKYVPSGQFSEMSGRGIAGKAAWWAPTPVRRLRTIAITHQHLLLLALLLASPVVARAAQAAEGTATVPRFEPASCPKLQGAEALAEASCGYLVVPEDRSRPSGRTIRLMVAKYPAHSSEKRADPVVYLAGGPVTSPPHHAGPLTFAPNGARPKLRRKIVSNVCLA